MTETPRTAPIVDLGALRRAGEAAVGRAASAPVRHVTPEFLAALNCRDLDEVAALLATGEAT